jgi:hypothetical protein
MATYHGAQPCQRRKQPRPRAGTLTAKIYDHFVANEGEPVNSREFADELGISVTTMGNVIERINNAYNTYIISQGRGYYILLTEEELV